MGGRKGEIGAHRSYRTQTGTRTEREKTEGEGCAPTRSSRRIQANTTKINCPSERQLGRRRPEAPPHAWQWPRKTEKEHSS